MGVHVSNPSYSGGSARRIKNLGIGGTEVQTQSFTFVRQVLYSASRAMPSALLLTSYFLT
jgi:hypothetical protein